MCLTIAERSPRSQRLFELRKKAGLTQGQLGKLVGITGSAIGAIERGHKKLSFRVAQALSKALNIDLGDIADVLAPAGAIATFALPKAGNRELDDLIFFRHVRELRSFVTARKEALGANPEYDNITAGLDLIVEAFHRLRKA
jgi:transcriptional regulator with XRE-family HTH domain